MRWEGQSGPSKWWVSVAKMIIFFKKAFKKTRRCSRAIINPHHICLFNPLSWETSLELVYVKKITKQLNCENVLRSIYDVILLYVYLLGDFKK